MRLLLRLLAVAGLAVDAYVHLDLASRYDAIGSSLTQGQLFRAEAALAILAAVALLLSDRPATWLLAGVVALGGLGAVLLYRYVNVPAIGPLPRMYEPVWYGEKALSAVSQAAVAALAAGVLLAGLVPRRAAQRA